jgi:hypothetical protein
MVSPTRSPPNPQPIPKLIQRAKRLRAQASQLSGGEHGECIKDTSANNATMSEGAEALPDQNTPSPSAFIPPDLNRSTLPPYTLESLADAMTADLPLAETSASSMESPLRSLTQHNYTLTNKKAKPWATLTLHSSAHSPQQKPIFLGDQPITGSVSLSLDKEDSIATISISVSFLLSYWPGNLTAIPKVKGKIITHSQHFLPLDDSYAFLDYRHMLWSKVEGESNTISQSEVQHSDKLVGGYCWAFSFCLPNTVTIPPTHAEDPRSYCLPQTLMETLIRASIQYEIALDITRTKLRSNSGYLILPMNK